MLTEHRVKQVLVAYGLPKSSDVLARSAAEQATPRRFGFPVVLKIQSPDIPHKTEAGGVRLNLTDANAVQSGVSRDHRRRRTLPSGCHHRGRAGAAYGAEGI